MSDKPLGHKKLFFIDLDGTVYLGNTMIQGAREFVSKSRALGKHVYFISNNSSKSKQEYVKKLNSLGISASEDDVVLSTDGVIEFLLGQGCKDIFVAGTNAMRLSFEKAGFNIDSSNPRYIILGYDTEVTYSKICRVALLLQRGVELIATHCDMVCPSPEGAIPDIGSMLALFRTATGKVPSRVFGKPNREMVAHLIARHSVTLEEVVVIGDRLYTDMELANRVGCDFICVLSGETTWSDIEKSQFKPAIIVENIGRLVDFV